MRVAIFGATGLTGKQVLREALARGHEVTALVRRPDALGVASERLRVVQGDALDPAAVERAVSGQDAVIHALGVGGKGDGKPSTLVSDATRLIVAAMEKQGVRRLICMSNIGAGDSWGETSLLFRKLILPLFLRWLVPIIEDKHRMEPIVTASALDWTLVRLPAILDRPARGSRRIADSPRGVGFTITASDTAAFLLDQIADPTYIRRAPSVSN